MASVTLHWAQSLVYRDLFIDKAHRFVMANCSRGFGKSYEACAGAATAVFELMQLDWKVPNKNVAIIAPTYEQVTDIYHPMLSNEFALTAAAFRAS